MLLYAFLRPQYHTLGNSFQVSVIDGNISDLWVASISFRYTNFALFFLIGLFIAENDQKLHSLHNKKFGRS